jgi:hypothetical protein
MWFTHEQPPGGTTQATPAQIGPGGIGTSLMARQVPQHPSLLWKTQSLSLLQKPRVAEASALPASTLPASTTHAPV